MAEITDYDTLKSEIGRRMKRPNQMAYFGGYIQRAEKALSRKFASKPVWLQELRVQAPVVSEYTDLPTDFQSMKKCYLVLSSSATPPLEFYPNDTINDAFAGATSGQPRAYSIVGDSIQLRPVPDGQYRIGMVYIKKLTPLSTSNTSNWLLEHSPDLYLEAALVEGFLDIFDENRAAIAKAKRDEAFDELMLEHKRHHAGARPVMRSQYYGG